MESKWDAFACKLIATYRLESRLPSRFSHEVDIIRTLFNVDELSETIRKWLVNLPDIQPCTDEKSNRYRQRGNEIFKSKTNDHLALEAYSKAIFAASEGSTALALGHANRAVLLIRFGRYREAYDDCQLALIGGYPESNRLKVYLRQAECAKQLNDGTLLDAAVECISEIAATTQLSQTEMEQIGQLKSSQVMLSNQSRNNNEKNSGNDELVPPATTLKEQINPYAGRHMVTFDMVEENEVIARETAVSFIPVYGSDSTSSIPSFDCQKCGTVNVIPFPCAICGQACYCSSKCRTDHTPVHRHECFGYKKLLWYHIGIAHLGIRSFLDGFEPICYASSKENCALSCFEALITATKSGDNEFGNYGRLFRLVTNFERMDFADILQYSLVSFMLTVYLRDCTKLFDSNYISCNIAMSYEELFIFYGSLIFRHVGQLVCNGHAISELHGTLPSVMNCFEKNNFLIKPGLLHRYFTSSRVFTAIFPRISLCNHSCDPNIRNHFEGSTLTVHATRAINAEEEIFNCYGPHYKTMPTWERKMHLSRQYCFDCNCLRCSVNDDSCYNMYNLIECPLQGCKKSFSLSLSEKDLLEGLKCPLCGGEINCSWYTAILHTIEEAQNYTSNQLRQCLQAYEKGCRMLTKYNVTKIKILHSIIDHFLQFAGIDMFCMTSLKRLVNEFVMLRRHQFGYMSLEFIVGCFYLIDLLAIESHVTTKMPVYVDGEHEHILNEFRNALSIVGSNTRSTILYYFEKYSR